MEITAQYLVGLFRHHRAAVLLEFYSLYESEARRRQSSASEAEHDE